MPFNRERISLPSPQDKNFLDKVKELLEVREGYRSTFGKAYVTFDDLAHVDFAKTVKDTPPYGPVVSTDGSIPKPPSNFHIVQETLGNRLYWTQSPSADVWYYEIWYHTSNDRTSATKLASVPHPIETYFHALNASTVLIDKWYWMRAVSYSGLYSTWVPPDAMGGEVAPGAASYAELIQETVELLEGQIREGSLYPDLKSSIDTPKDLLDALSLSIMEYVSEANERYERLALEKEVTDATIHVDPNTGQIELKAVSYIKGEVDVRIGVVETFMDTHVDDVSAHANRFDNVFSYVDGEVANVSTEISTHVTANEAHASLFDAVWTEFSDNHASYTSQIEAVADDLSGEVSRIDTLFVDVGDLEGSIETTHELIVHEDTGVHAKYSVKVNANGHVAGFGLISKPNLANGQTTEFGVVVDKFWIAHPDGNPAKNRIPFIIDQDQIRLAGVIIQDDSIMAGHIGADQINASHIQANEIDGTHISAAADIIIGHDDPAHQSDYCRIHDGDIDFFMYDPITDTHKAHKNLRKIEFGVAKNDEEVIVPGPWRENPNIIIAPHQMMIFNHVYGSAQDQFLTFGWAAIGDGLNPVTKEFHFKPQIMLHTGSADFTGTVDTTLTGWGTKTWGWQTTPANTTEISISCNYDAYNYEGNNLGWIRVRVYIEVDGIGQTELSDLAAHKQLIRTVSGSINVSKGTHSFRLKIVAVTDYLRSFQGFTATWDTYGYKTTAESTVLSGDEVTWWAIGN